MPHFQSARFTGNVDNKNVLEDRIFRCDSESVDNKFVLEDRAFSCVIANVDIKVVLECILKIVLHFGLC